MTDIEPLLELEVGLNPVPDGLGGVSQLPTWIWCEFTNPAVVDGTVTAGIDIDGWAVAATARVASLTWTIDGPDGHIERSATSCGEAPDPDSDGSAAAASWTPNLPGEYTVTLAAEWGGEWTRSRGSASQTLDLGTVAIAGEPITYTVVEIQTVGRRG